MVPVENLVAFTVAAWLIIVVPGPSVLFVVSRAMTLGRRGAFATVIGNAAGEFTQAAAVAVGIGAVVEQSVLAYNLIKYVGAAYLVYLGVRALLRRDEAPESTSGTAAPRSTATVLREGYVVGVVNPKTIVFMAAILPQFVDRAAGAVPAQLLILGAVFTLVALVSDSIWALGAGTVRAWFARSPGRIAGLRRVGAAVMIGLGARLAITGRPD